MPGAGAALDACPAGALAVEVAAAPLAVASDEGARCVAQPAVTVSSAAQAANHPFFIAHLSMESEHADYAGVKRRRDAILPCHGALAIDAPGKRNNAVSAHAAGAALL